MTRRLQILALILPLTVLWAAPAFAQGPPAGDELRWSLGLGVISAPRPYVDARNSTRAIPLLELYYRGFFVQGIRMGYRLAESPTSTLAVIAGPRFLGHDEGDSPFLRGMEARGQAIDVGLAASWRRQGWGIAGQVRRDVSGHSDGTQVGAELYLARSALQGRLRLQPALGLEWQDASTVDYYYGVRPEEARPDRPAYRGGATVNGSLGLFLYYRLGRRLDLVTVLNASLLGDAAADSPIVDRKASWFGLVGVTHRF